MLKSNLLNTFLILIILITPISSGFAISSENIKKSSYIENLDTCESHIIEGVPYVGQTNLYCCQASLTMILKYYDINTTLEEVLYYIGAGYSIGYTYNRLLLIPFYELSYNKDDMEFLSLIYGLSAEFYHPKIIIEPISWQIYWEKIKQYINRDIPIQTSIDMGTIPYYKDKCPHMTLALHSIVIVGYDENKDIVYYNDPGTAVFTNSEDGTYANMSIETLRKAAHRAFFEMKLPLVKKYRIWAYEKVTDPLPKEKALELAHKRNIQRMKGDKYSYDKDCRKPYREFGINALERFKRDLESINPTILTISYKISNITGFFNFYPFASMPKIEKGIYVEKLNISQFLIKNGNLSSNCMHDAILIKQEAQYWKHLSQLHSDLYTAIHTNNILKAIQLSKTILDKMINVIDVIISIEKLLINDTKI